MKLKKALLIVDLQNDFCPGGALAVKDGDKIIPAVNRYIRFFSRNKLPILLTRDWHPKNTRHFKGFGGQWPRHCVKDSRGAQFHPGLKIPKEAIILNKGMDTEKEGYSAFHALDSNGIEFSNLLKMFGVDELFICGLATDYCIKWSVLDALKFGFKVNVLVDAIKGVNLRPYDSEESLVEMVKSGARKMTLERLSIR